VKRKVADDTTTDVQRPAPPGFERGANWNSDDARKAYDEAGHDFDAIQAKEEPVTFADGSVASGTAPQDDLKPEPSEEEPVEEESDEEPEPEDDES
jgi:hypothetical protein